MARSPDNPKRRPPGFAAGVRAPAPVNARIAVSLWSRVNDERQRERMVAILEGLLGGNRRFVAGTPAPRDHDRERKALVSGQRPVAAVLTCSDSRIAIEDTFDAPLGTLFGVKTAGSTVDFAVLGSIEYSVSSLDTPLVIVMGHEGCGAVRAAFDRDAADGALGTLIGQLRRNMEGAETYDAAIHANARATVRRLLDGSALLMAAFERGKIAVVPAFYRLAEGLVDLLG